MEKNTSFTEGKIMQPLLLFAVPVLLALFLQAMYGAVDLLIVGKFASSADVSAVSTGSQIMTTPYHNSPAYKMLSWSIGRFPSSHMVFAATASGVIS